MKQFSYVLRLGFLRRTRRQLKAIVAQTSSFPSSSLSAKVNKLQHLPLINCHGIRSHVANYNAALIIALHRHSLQAEVEGYEIVAKPDTLSRKSSTVLDDSSLALWDSDRRMILVACSQSQLGKF